MEKSIDISRCGQGFFLKNCRLLKQNILIYLAPFLNVSNWLFALLISPVVQDIMKKKMLISSHLLPAKYECAYFDIFLRNTIQKES